MTEEVVAVIDFGTTTTSMRVLRNGEVYNPVEIPEQDNLCNSVFSVTERGVKFEPGAIGLKTVTIRNVKRILGKTKADFGDTPLDKDVYGAEICVDDEDKGPYFNVQLGKGKDAKSVRVNPEDAMAEVFKYCKSAVNEKTHQDVTICCLTIPNFVTDKAKRIMKKAAEEVGMICSFFIKEPTAAGVQFFKNSDNNRVSPQRIREKEKVLVFDFGGGTLDLTLMYRQGDTFIVIGQGGNPNLGGNRIDVLLADYIEKQFQLLNNRALFETRIGPRFKRHYNLLLLLCRSVKETLSKDMEAEVSVMGIGTADEGDETDLHITRQQFEEIIHPVLQECRKCVMNLLSQCSVRSTGIGHVIMVGGSSKIPALYCYLSSTFRRVVLTQDPQTLVVTGAMIAFRDNIVDSFLEESLECDLACKVDGKYQIHIPRGVSLPTKVSHYYTLTATRNRMELPVYRWVTDHWHKEGAIIISELPSSTAGFIVDLYVELEVKVDIAGCLHYLIRNCNDNTVIASTEIELN